ncbi:MAG: TatD family hydrolase [Reichenbachiella sp.]
MELIETHAHLYSDQFTGEISEVINRSQDQGVSKIYMPNVDSESIDGMLELEHQYPGYCIPMMGLHPCSVKQDFEKELYLVEDWLSKRDFVAIGEMGTDLYWDKSFWEEQKESFNIQCTLAIKHDKPIIIHCRESMEETIELIEQNSQEGKLKGIVHCFSGNEEQAKKIIALGFSIGLGGVATFKNGGLEPVMKNIDLAHMVLETDSPYLAPVPHRGKRNEPSFLSIVAQRIADMKEISMEEVAKVTSENANLIF